MPTPPFCDLLVFPLSSLYTCVYTHMQLFVIVLVCLPLLQAVVHAIAGVFKISLEKAEDKYLKGPSLSERLDFVCPAVCVRISMQSYLISLNIFQLT